MTPKIVDRILDKVPISKELKDTIEENVDLTKALSKELYTNLLGQGDKIKEEATTIIAREIKEFLSKIDTEEILRKTLEEMEVDIKVTFKKKEK